MTLRTRRHKTIPDKSKKEHLFLLRDTVLCQQLLHDGRRGLAHLVQVRHVDDRHHAGLTAAARGGGPETGFVPATPTKTLVRFLQRL